MLIVGTNLGEVECLNSRGDRALRKHPVGVFSERASMQGRMWCADDVRRRNPRKSDYQNPRA